MTPLQAVVVSNDNCPAAFPTTALQDNTTVNFDLVHATSNKFVDPSFKQINCKSTGTSVTNNAYYAFFTGTKTQVSMAIKNYTTVPAELASCTGQSVRLALYDVQTCQKGQSYPQPVICSTFNGNGTVNLSGLQQNHGYLLYVDGVRNTKASFDVVFNGDSSASNAAPVVTVFPNPLTTSALNIKIENTSGSSYQYALFDVLGKMLLTGTLSVNLPVQTFSINARNIAAGVYIFKLVDENGKKIATKKIIKQNQ